MRISINNEMIDINDKIANTYTSYVGPLNEIAISFLVQADGFDITKLSGNELVTQVEKSILNELEAMELLTRPEMQQKLIEFANKNG